MSTGGTAEAELERPSRAERKSLSLPQVSGARRSKRMAREVRPSEPSLPLIEDANEVSEGRKKKKVLKSVLMRKKKEADVEEEGQEILSESCDANTMLNHLSQRQEVMDKKLSEWMEKQSGGLQRQDQLLSALLQQLSYKAHLSVDDRRQISQIRKDLLRHVQPELEPGAKQLLRAASDGALVCKTSTDNLIAHEHSMHSMPTVRSVTTQNALQVPRGHATTRSSTDIFGPVRSVSFAQGPVVECASSEGEDSEKGDSPDGETAPKVAQIARIQTIKTMRNSTDREQAFSQLRQRQMTDRFQNVTHGSKEMLTQVVALLTTAVHSPWFEWCMLLFVVASAIVVGVEVNKGAVNAESTSPDPGLMAVKHMLTLIFVLEVAAKLLVDGLNFFRVDLGWNVLDMAIVVAGTIEFCWDMTVDSGEKGGEHGLLTAVRVGRALRLLRIHRLIHQVKALRMIYHSMLATMRSLFWAIALLSIIVYCFAVVFQQAVNDSNFLQQQELENLPHEKRLFTSISRTFGTLLQSCTGGLNWWEVEQALLEIHWFWVAVFLLYFSLIYFAMMNVVTAVFCSSAIERASMDQEAAIQEQLVKSSQYSETLRNVFSSMDSDKDGRVNIAEFEEKFDDPRCKALLGSLGIDEDKAWKLFEILDADCTGDISPEEFVSQGLRMRGSALRIDVERTYAAIKRQSLLIEDLNCQLDGLKEVINALQEKRGSGSTKSTHSEPRSSVET